MRLSIAILTTLLFVMVARGESITVSAAISLKEAITEIGKVYETQTGDHVDFNFGASGPLAVQIQQGAPVDAFISAANQQVDQLIKSANVDARTRRIIVKNQIVLIVPATASNPPKDFAALADQSIKSIAMGQPKSVPAGQYAAQTLAALKLTDALTPKLIYGANVRQVLDYVQRNEVDAGIVYRTDAKEAGQAVKVMVTADSSTHEPIEYPAVVVMGSGHSAAAEKFLDFLASEPARMILSAKGFELPTSPTTMPGK